MADIELSNCLIIEVHTGSYRAVRGYTVVAALCDESAFWRSDESPNPDKEILAALRPAMATIPNGLLIGLSSPYRRAGALYEAYRDHYGKDGDAVLVWQADTQTMNPTVPKSVIDDAYARDPASASAEYGAQFRSDVAGFLQEEWIETAVDHGTIRASIVGPHTISCLLRSVGGRERQFHARDHTCGRTCGAKDADRINLCNLSEDVARSSIHRGSHGGEARAHSFRLL